MNKYQERSCDVYNSYTKETVLKAITSGQQSSRGIFKTAFFSLFLFEVSGSCAFLHGFNALQNPRGELDKIRSI